MAGINVIQADETSGGSKTPAKKVSPKAKPSRKSTGPRQTKK